MLFYASFHFQNATECFTIEREVAGSIPRG